jgi:NTP pyrophosphatase (non-canonical NTP hydrolase)
MSINTFDEYQKTVFESLTIYPQDAKVLYPALGLSGEVAEVAEKVSVLPTELRALATELTLKMGIHAGLAANQVKKIIRDDDCEITAERQAAIAKEIGGVLWYCAALATDLRLNLGDIARGNIELLSNRKERGTLRGDGDDR